MHLLEHLAVHAREGKIAAVSEEGILSYAALCEHSDAFAAYMNDNCDDKSPVIIIGDKQNEILSFIFGSIKSRHPYVFIPSHYPIKRIFSVIEDCGAKTVICFDKSKAEQDGGFTDMSAPGAFEREFGAYAGRSVPAESYASGSDLWAIFYTSGSTGVPKGVRLSGRNFLAKVGLLDMLDKYYSGTTDILNFSSYAFSISIPTLFYSVVKRGSTLHAIPQALLRNYPALFEFMLSKNPHIITATPSFMEVCLRNPKFSDEYFTHCRYICFGGEALPKSVFTAVRERFPNADISNGYGATETASAPFIVFLDEKVMENCDSDIMPVGYDDGTLGRLSIVDENGNELPDGENGEFITVGDYVCEGYHNRAEQSGKAFFTAPDGKRGYRTNDIMFRRNNYFYYCGRKDNLVKVGGYRVELEDVEFNLRKVDIVRSCAVVPVTRGGSVIMLAAYVVLSDSAISKISAIQQIKKQLSELVQSYMIPQKIVILDELPRNNSGKIDRVKLREQTSL